MHFNIYQVNTTQTPTILIFTKPAHVRVATRILQLNFRSFPGVFQEFSEEHVIIFPY